jgi:hypothetical protein
MGLMLATRQGRFQKRPDFLRGLLREKFDVSQILSEN